MCSYANGKECHEGGPTAVGSHRPNAFGLDDMTGNEFEWVEDCWHRTYGRSSRAWQGVDQLELRDICHARLRVVHRQRAPEVGLP
jgi:formylglycine-generating enzyme required for sulfatase activity